MPVIKSAIKKLRQDRKREKMNDQLRDVLKSSVRAAKKTKNGKTVSKANAVIDKAAKAKIIHPNKASRLKSSLSKIAKAVSTKEKPAPKKVTASKKSTAVKKTAK